MIENNDIFSVIKYIWEWCGTTVWYDGFLFGKPVQLTISVFFYFPLIASFLIYVIRLIFWLIDD